MARELDENDYLMMDKLLLTGDPYIILGSSVSDSKYEIKNRYIDIIENGIDSLSKEEMEAIENAYQLLSNDEYRNTFDEYIASQQHKDKSLGGNLPFSPDQMKSLAFKIASIPFLNMQTIFNSPNNISFKQSKAVIKSIYQLKGIRGLYRGVAFSTSAISVEAVRITFLEIIYQIFQKLSGKKLEKSTLDKIESFTYFFTGYPTKLVIDCLLLAPFSVTTFQVIRDIVYKKPYYAALYAIPLLVLNKEIRVLVDKCSNKFKQYAKIDGVSDDKDVENQVGPIVKYSAIILTNPITTSIIKSLLCCPLNAIYATYPTLMINSYLNGSSILPIAMNPLTIASNAYKTFGVSFFFRGFAVGTVYRILDTIGKSYDPNSQELIFE